METHAGLVGAVERALVDMGLGDDTGRPPSLPGSDQMMTNALGLTLALRWARSSVSTACRGRLHTYAPEHVNERTSHFEGVPKADFRKMKPRWHRYSFLVDVFIEEWRSSGARMTEVPVLAAEVEGHPGHGVADDIDHNDYQWDFYKLVHVRAPRRLFVASARADRLDELTTSLSAAWTRTREAVANENDRLAVVLLPARGIQWVDTRVGVALGKGPLDIRPVWTLPDPRERSTGASPSRRGVRRRASR